MNPSIPTNNGLMRRLAAGYGMQAVNIAALLSLQLLIVPVLLWRWGTGIYGDWLVLSAGAGFFALADLGVANALGNRFRAMWSRGEAEAFRRTVQIGLWIGAGLVAAAGTAVLSVATAVDLTATFGLTEGTDAASVFLWLGLANVLAVPRGILIAIYSARGFFGREGALNLAFFGGPILVQGIVAALGGGPATVAAAHFTATLLLGPVLQLFDIKRRHRDVPLRALRPTRQELAGLGASAPLYLVPAAASMLQLQVPVLLLGVLAESVAVVAFTTMRTFTGLTRQVALQLFVVASVEMARQYTQRDEDGLLRLYSGSGRLIGGIAGLLAGLSLVFGPLFFSLWTHGTVVFDPVLAGVFLGTVLALGPGLGSTWLLRHTDHPGTMAALFVAQILLGTLLCGALLAAGLGATGAALGVGLAELIAPGLLSMVVVGRLLRVRMHRLALSMYATTGLALLIGSGAGLAAVRVFPGSGVAELVAAIALWAAAVAIPAPVLLLDSRQRGRLWQLLPGFGR